VNTINERPIDTTMMIVEIALILGRKALAQSRYDFDRQRGLAGSDRKYEPRNWSNDTGERKQWPRQRQPAQCGQCHGRGSASRWRRATARPVPVRRKNVRARATTMITLAAVYTPTPRMSRSFARNEHALRMKPGVCEPSGPA